MTYVPTAWVLNSAPALTAIQLNRIEHGIDIAQGDVMVLYGTTAALPATDPELVGRLYFENDLLLRVWRDNGAGWDLVAVPHTSLLLETGQTTAYSVFDDGDQEVGVDKAYTVQAAGDYAGNTNIEVAHYAAAGITFNAAASRISDAANGLVTFLAGDTVVVKGSTLNDGVYTVALGANPAQFLTVEALVNEAAGAMVSFYKRTAHSNNAVDDDETGRQWSRNTSTGERVGVLSNGTLNWYDVATRFAIYAAANTVSMIMPGNIIRVIGGAALTQFHVGDMIQCAGFANPDNNLPNMYVVSATVNGADLDILVNPGNEVLIAEGAVGDTIYLNCRSIYNYMAGARLAGLSNLTDWRTPNLTELLNLMNHEAPNAMPDAVAFPVWGVTMWPSTTEGANVANSLRLNFTEGSILANAKTSRNITALVRG